MVKISIQYPNTPGARFDFDYYVGTHMPMAIELLSAHPGYQRISVEKGLGGAQPDSPPAYIAVCDIFFDSIEDFLAAFMPNAPVLQGDMPNYTDVEPVIQFNEVLLVQ